MITTTMMRKQWKVSGFTRRVLNVNADAVISYHDVMIVTEDDGEMIMAIKLDHFETLEPSVRSRLEVALAHHVVGLHNNSLNPKQPLTESKGSATLATPVTVTTPKRKGGWPKGKPRKPNVKEVQGKAAPSPRSGGSTDQSASQTYQGGQVEKKVQPSCAGVSEPTGEGWFRP